VVRNAHAPVGAPVLVGGHGPSSLPPTPHAGDDALISVVLHRGRVQGRGDAAELPSPCAGATQTVNLK
jgi:hypothetical protein